MSPLFLYLMHKHTSVYKDKYFAYDQVIDTLLSSSAQANT